MKSLKNVLAIVSEVEFITLYINQPLFGDVCSFLASQELSFHHFLGLAGRTLHPIIINANDCSATQHLWADALFVRDVQTAGRLTARQLLKLSVLALLYGSPDLTYYCLAIYDQQKQTQTAKTFLDAVSIS